MSVMELKRVVDQASEEERIFLAAYLQHVERASDPQNAAELERRLLDMESGKKIDLKDFKKTLGL